jgi:hypothetical protein
LDGIAFLGPSQVDEEADDHQEGDGAEGMSTSRCSSARLPDPAPDDPRPTRHRRTPGGAARSGDGGRRSDAANQPGNMAGEAATGVVLKRPLKEISEAIAPAKDHHVAEYRALIRGLEAARSHGIGQ